MLMESIGNMKLKQLYEDKQQIYDYYLDEMQIQYMSVGKKDVTFTANVLNDDYVDNNRENYSPNTIRIAVKASTKGGKPISEGLLTFRKCEEVRSRL